jgi:hypothetical protein
VVCPLQEGVKIAVTDNELRNTGSQQRRGRLSSEDTDAADACEQILQELPTPATLVVSRRVPLREVSIHQRSQLFWRCYEHPCDCCFLLMPWNCDLT